MDSLQNPESNSEYDHCKYKLKLWEHQFKKTNGRLPSKLDIREADKEVRDAYKTYYRLKTAILEQKLMDAEGFDIEDSFVECSTETSTPVLHNIDMSRSSNIDNDDVWGKHLNYIKKSNESKLKNTKSSVNLSFTQKLFAGAMASKNLQRRSLSFSRKRSTSKIEKPKFLSQPGESTEHSLITTDPDLSDLNVSHETNNDVKTCTPIVTALTQPTNLLKQAVDCNYNCKPSRKLDLGWVYRNTENIPIENRFSDNEDIIGNSDTEQDISCNLSQIAKKRKISHVSVFEDLSNKKSFNHKSPNKLKLNNDLITVDVQQRRLDFSNIFTEKLSHDSQNESGFQDEPTLVNKNAKKKLRSNNTVNGKDSFEYNSQSSTQASNKTNSEKSKTYKESALTKKKLRNNKTVKYVDDKDPSENNLQNSKSASNNTNSEGSKTYELEYSVKPRVVKAPRVKNLKEIISKTNTMNKIKLASVTTKIQNNKDKLEQKMEAGTLNDNFVQINLKKKIYVRGKKTMTFAKHKKLMWKNKKKTLCGPDMDMSGCDGGILKCFNCGDAGHFARYCPNGKGDSLLSFNKEDEEECPYPTLEEAEMMARKSALALRKPSQINDINSTLDNNSQNDLFGDDMDADLLDAVSRLEEDIANVDVHKFIDSTTHVKPYYELTEDGKIIDTPKDVFKALHKFGHTSFRVGQEQAIMRILSGKSTLVTLSTGSGKSLCYQLPAYLYSNREPCISLIISPLVSLMDDQVTGMPSFLKAACLHTNQTKTQRAKIMDALSSGNINVLLVSPEAVVAGEKSAGFGSLLRKLPPIAFACIDEAHCVSQWSHNFRPSYLKICRVLKERLGIRTILALTATATRATMDSIIQHLSIPDGIDGIISSVPLPDNLRLTVSRDINRDKALLALITSEKFANFTSIVIYCTRREECQRVASFLRTCLQDKNDDLKRKRLSLAAEPYHAGLSSAKRKTIQKLFMSGELRIVVATVAFGMGINKSDIRAVIHYNMPNSFESYVQEVGRAGRDGLAAHCHLFLNSQGKDENELRRHSYANSTDRHAIRKLLQLCFVPCSCTSTCPRHEVAFSIQDTVQALDVPEENIETLLCYLELHQKQYIELLSHAYVTCKIISYGGPNVMRKAAQSCPPLAMALALYNKEEKTENTFEFPVVELASVMGWDSGICKHVLKNLEWISVNNQPKRSNLTVQFSNLGFHLLAPGNLTDSALDEALDTLYERVKQEEDTTLMQLHALHTTLTSVAVPNFQICLVEETSSNEVLLKSKIREYFESPKPLALFLPETEVKPINEEQIIKDVCSLVHSYRENTFTGRSVARIFYGIQSPNYPAVVWGKCKYWRAHLDVDFNTICKIATKEILRMK